VSNMTDPTKTTARLLQLPKEVARPMPRYRKKPVVIDAFQLGEAWPDWWADAVTANQVTTHNADDRWRGGPDYALIKTLEGEMRAEKGDWIIRGVKGEIYPCKPDIFAATYDEVSPT
jgi:hypothetical protein